MNILADLQLRTVTGRVVSTLTTFHEAHARLSAARIWQRPSRRRQLREAELIWHSARQTLIDIVAIGSDLQTAERVVDDLVAEYIAQNLYPIHHTIAHLT
ncbi:hypothetical protein [Streptosporangium sandarakinum]|uniref:hypothetical protein n=1 Tax=Streptosporangium sandarakinum TaxID=1260955 RepID=UPI0037AE154A